MISTDSVQTIIGRDAFGPGGEKLGTIGQVYLDNDSGTPEWATVKTGFFGTHESFVPLRQAELSGDGVQLPYDKERVKKAPSIDADRDLTPEEETALYEYYGISSGYTGTTTGYGTEGTTSEGYHSEGYTTGSEGYSTGRTTDTTDTYDTDTYDTREAGTYETGRYGSSDDAMTRSEEQVRTGTESREAGRARLRKYIVTEQQQVSVPVTHEEARIEREPITDANREQALSGPDLTESEHEVVLNEERPVIQKETVPVERVRLTKDQVTDEHTANVDVRQERIESDADTDTEVGTDRR